MLFKLYSPTYLYYHPATYISMLLSIPMLLSMYINITHAVYPVYTLCSSVIPAIYLNHLSMSIKHSCATYHVCHFTLTDIKYYMYLLLFSSLSNSHNGVSLVFISYIKISFYNTVTGQCMNPSSSIN